MTPKFVEFIPSEGEDLIPGVLFISMKHNTVVHRCPCGCGELSEFMLDPIRYRIEYDGREVTFDPSIGNSNLQCRSHYWIRKSRIEWCAPMEDWQTKQAQKLELSKALEVRCAEETNGLSKTWKRLVNWWRK